MASIYKKTMREALEQARNYRDPEELTEKLPFDYPPVKGYWDKDGAARGVPDIFYSMKKGNQKKNIHPKDLKKFEKDGWRWYDSTTESKGHLSYDVWLKQVKGIKKGAYGINSDEHAKYSGEWRAYIKGLFDNLPPANKAKNVTKLSPTAHTKLGENELNEIVGGHGEMTVTKDGGVMIIKTKDWQTYKAKGWAKKTNESLDLSATGDTITSNASQEVEGEELDEVHFSNIGEPPAPKGMHKLRSGRDIPSSPKVDKIHKKVAAMTDRNDHFGATIQLAKECGDKDLVQIYKSLELMHKKYGVVGNKSIELRQIFSPVLNNQLDRKFGKYANVLRDAL